MSAFDELAYLQANPDVYEAVMAGAFQSGEEHYITYGKQEGRSPSGAPSNRKEKVFQLLNRSGKGLEIGPSHNPIASKREGFNVQIVDHLSATQLKEKYRGHNVNIDNIEEC